MDISGRAGKSLEAVAAFGAAIVCFVSIAMPKMAMACSVCTAGRDEENQTAFLLSTLFMSLLPLVAIGSIIYFLYRRIQKVEAAEEARISAADARSGGVELEAPST